MSKIYLVLLLSLVLIASHAGSTTLPTSTGYGGAGYPSGGGGYPGGGHSGGGGSTGGGSYCGANYIWNGGCLKLCTHPDFNNCPNVFPALWNPSFCALLRNGQWRSYTYACQACKDSSVIGVKVGKCSCQVEPCPSGQSCISGTCSSTPQPPQPPSPGNCGIVPCGQGYQCVFGRCVPVPGYCGGQTYCRDYEICL